MAISATLMPMLPNAVSGPLPVTSYIQTAALANNSILSQKDFLATILYSFDAFRSNTMTRGRRRSTYFVDGNNPRLPDGSLNPIRTWAGSATI